jgi:hypothetical protein
LPVLIPGRGDGGVEVRRVSRACCRRRAGRKQLSPPEGLWQWRMRAPHHAGWSAVVCRAQASKIRLLRDNLWRQQHVFAELRVKLGSGRALRSSSRYRKGPERSPPARSNQGVGGHFLRGLPQARSVASPPQCLAWACDCPGAEQPLAVSVARALGVPPSQSAAAKQAVAPHASIDSISLVARSSSLRFLTMRCALQSRWSTTERRRPSRDRERGQPGMVRSPIDS